MRDRDGGRVTEREREMGLGKWEAVCENFIYAGWKQFNDQLKKWAQKWQQNEQRQQQQQQQ